VIGMALTRDFKQTVAERVQRDPGFATICFKGLAAATRG
jgi:hypothetical protein